LHRVFAHPSNVIIDHRSDHHTARMNGVARVPINATKAIEPTDHSTTVVSSYLHQATGMLGASLTAA
jgi:hypothetical protein